MDHSGRTGYLQKYGARFLYRSSYAQRPLKNGYVHTVMAEVFTVQGLVDALRKHLPTFETKEH